MRDGVILRQAQNAIHKQDDWSPGIPPATRQALARKIVELERAARVALGAQAEQILSRFRGKTPEQLLALFNNPETWANLRRDLEAVLRRKLGEIASQGAQDVQDGELRDEPRFKLPHAEAQRWANEHAAELVTQIDDNTRQQVRDEVARAIEGGVDPRDLRERVGEVLRSGADYRARRIAETEVMTAYHQGTVESFRASGQVWGKQWKAALGGACNVCRALNGQVARMGEPFTVSVDGERYVIPEGQQAHPHCRCSVGPITFRQALQDPKGLSNL